MVHRGMWDLCIVGYGNAWYVVGLWIWSTGYAAGYHYDDVTWTSWVSNHRSFHCLFNSLCGPTSKKHQSPRYWPFVRGIHRWPVNSPHRGPVTHKKLPFDDVTMTMQGSSPSYGCQMACSIVKNLVIKPLVDHWYMMTSSNGNIFRDAGPLWGKSAGHRWIPITKASGALIFLWSGPEQTAEPTLETPVIWDAIALMTSL